MAKICKILIEKLIGNEEDVSTIQSDLEYGPQDVPGSSSDFHFDQIDKDDEENSKTK
jgi:hypothetical protein